MPVIFSVIRRPLIRRTYSSKRLADFLETQGFQVAWKTAGIDTAFTAVWGSGKPMLGFLAEYDALPEIGHACGHNLLGTAVCAAACALKEDMTASGAQGTIIVYGCPAEEIMSGKIVMNDAGVFDDLDVGVMAIHLTAIASATTSGSHRISRITPSTASVPMLPSHRKMDEARWMLRN